MPHVQKYTQTQIALILAHNLRSKETSYKSADKSLEKNNLYYLYNGERLEQVHADNKTLQERARKRQKYLFDNLPHAKRKDLVTMAEWIVTCPQSVPTSDRIKFLKASMDCISERYGVESITAAAMHLDEPNAMPHLHITFVPVDGKGRICARNVLTRRELQRFHPQLEQYVSAKLGYDVHILREPEERTKVSKPLSQFKAETLQKKAEERMVEAIKHEEQAEELKRSAQAVRNEAVEKERAADQTLMEAKTTVSNAQMAARAAAANRTKDYQSKGFLDWIKGRKNPVEYVHSVSVDLETAARLQEQQVKEKENAIAARESQVANQEKTLERRKDELEEQQRQLEQQRKQFDQEREAAAKEQEKVHQEQQKREKELQQRLLDAQRAAEQAKEDRAKTYENRRAAEAAEKATEQKLSILSEQEQRFERNKQEYMTWKSQWLPIETANAKYEKERERADTYEKRSDNYMQKYFGEQKRAKDNDRVVKQQQKEIATVTAASNAKDETIKALQEQLKQQQEENQRLNVVLDNNDDYTMALRAELRAKNSAFPILRLSTDVKAGIMYLQEQTEAARQKTSYPKKLEYIEPPPQRIAEIKMGLEKHKSRGRSTGR